MPALSSAAPRPYRRPSRSAGLERVAVPVRGVAGRLDVVVRVQQDRGGAGRGGPVGRARPAGRPGGQHVDLGQARGASRAATSRALARRCGAAAGSADTDGIRTSRSRSARTDGRTCRTAVACQRCSGSPGPYPDATGRSGGRGLNQPRHRRLSWRTGAARRRSGGPSPAPWQLGVADDHHAVGDDGGPPVAPRRADRQQVERGHVLAVLGQQLVQALVRGDPAGALARLKMLAGVVAPHDRLRDPAVRDRLRPAGEQVGVGGVVHHVDHARAGRPGADLAEHHLAVGLAVPLHVGEPVAEPQRLHHGGAELPAALQVRCVQVAQRHGDRADPLVQLGDQRARAVLADVLEQHLPAGADGVVGELLAVDELLDDDLRHVPDHRQDRVELGG